MRGGSLCVRASRRQQTQTAINDKRVEAEVEREVHSRFLFHRALSLYTHSRHAAGPPPPHGALEPVRVCRSARGRRGLGVLGRAQGHAACAAETKNARLRRAAASRALPRPLHAPNSHPLCHQPAPTVMPRPRTLPSSRGPIRHPSTARRLDFAHLPKKINPLNSALSPSHPCSPAARPTLTRGRAQVVRTAADKMSGIVFEPFNEV